MVKYTQNTPTTSVTNKYRCYNTLIIRLPPLSNTFTGQKCWNTLKIYSPHHRNNRIINSSILQDKGDKKTTITKNETHQNLCQSWMEHKLAIDAHKQVFMSSRASCTFLKNDLNIMAYLPTDGIMWFLLPVMFKTFPEWIVKLGSGTYIVTSPTGWWFSVRRNLYSLRDCQTAWSPRTG